MRIAILSDIHSNFQAWNAVRDDLLRRNVDTVVCLGDVVGYGPNPSEVLASVQAVCANIVLGNHDAAAAGILDLDIFSEGARRSAIWTASKLTNANRAMLGDLPLTIEDGDVLYTHADCAAPDEWGYVETIENARASFAAVASRIIFLGHTHFPEVFTCAPDGSVSQSRHITLNLDPASRYIINVGSVGDPRDGGERASYVVFDLNAQRVEFYEVEFNVDAFARALASVPQLAMPWFLQRRAHESQAGEREHAVRIVRAPASPMRTKSGRVILKVSNDQLKRVGATVLKNLGTAPVSTSALPAKKSTSRSAWLISLLVIVLAIACCWGIYHLNGPHAPSAMAPSLPPATNEIATTEASAPAPEIPPPAPIELTAPMAKTTGSLCQQITKGITNFGCWTAVGSTATWTFNVPQRSAYELLLVSAVAQGAGGSYGMTCGKQQLSGNAVPTGDWFDYRTNRVGRITLDAGANSLAIKAGKMKYALMNLERIRLVPVATGPSK